MSNDYLIHHGILGMKWGIRRYQNEDGSLTPAGKKRQQKNFAKSLNGSSLSNKEYPLKQLDETFKTRI